MSRVQKLPVKRLPPADKVETFDCEQRSDEWYALRLGIVTASNLSAVMASSEEAKMRKGLLYRLAGEILSKMPLPTYSNADMERGIAMEPDALAHYAFTRNVELTRVGFVRRTIQKMNSDLVVGCSPDALVGADGLLQVKTMRPDLLVELVDSGRFPSEHRWQCHGELWVTGRKWCDLKVFYTGMPISPIWRVERNEGLIKSIDAEVEKFDWELRRLLERVRARKT